MGEGVPYSPTFVCVTKKIAGFCTYLFFQREINSNWSLQRLTYWLAIINFRPELDSIGCEFISARLKRY